MKKLLLLMLVSMVVTGVANAVFWNAAGTAPANWNVAGNWDPATIPSSSEKVSFPRDTAPCIVDDSDAVTPGIQPTLCGQFVLGDNGPDLKEHYITIPIGCTLHTCVPGDSWTAAGYNRVGHLTVEAGGTLITGSRMGIGLVASSNPTVASTLNVNGGSVSIDGDLQIGETNHIGIVNVNSGTLEATGWEWRDDTGTWSFMDIGLGQVIIDGDVTADIPVLTSNSALTGFGGSSTVNYDYNVSNPGSTTITADDPMDRWPGTGDLLIPPPNPLVLTWTNMAPVPPATQVWVDVSFGTDPANLAKVSLGTPDEASVDVGLKAKGEYCWQVDSYLYGDPALVDYVNDANYPVEEGGIIPFEIGNQGKPSVVIDSNDMGTWAGESVVVSATVTDDDLTQVIPVWTSSVGDPNVTLTNQTFNTVTGIATVTVTGDSWQQWVEITITVSDQEWTDADSDTSLVDIARDACHAAGGGSPHLWDDYTADFDRSCNVDLADFAVVYQQWLADYELTVPLEVP